jgi:hypothetical protein
MAQGSSLNKEDFGLSVFSANKGGALDILSFWVTGIVGRYWFFDYPAG